MKNKRLIQILKYAVNALWYLHWGILIYVTFMTLVGTFNLFDFGPKASIPVYFSLGEEGQVALSTGTLPVAINYAKGIIQLNHPVPINILIPGYLLTVVLLTLGLYIMYQLKTILRNIQAGEPFSEKNAAMIRNMGFALILTWAFKNLLYPILTLILMPKLQFESVEFMHKWNMEFNLLLVGLLMLVLGQIFRMGFEMKSEQDLTI